MTLEIIPRDKWGARSPKSRTTIPTPTPELFLHHSAGSEKGAAGMRRIQNFHMDGRGWSDIAYSYVIDRLTLAIYEGRGAGVRGGHTFGHNSRSHGICVMGNFNVVTPSPELLERIAELVAYGIGRGWWRTPFTGGHRDVRPTDCPGDRLYPNIAFINTRALALLEETTTMPPDRTAEITEAQTKLINEGGTRFYAGQPDGDFGPLSLDGVHKAVNRANQADQFEAERDDARRELRVANDEVTRLERLLDEAMDVDEPVDELAEFGRRAVSLFNDAHRFTEEA